MDKQDTQDLTIYRTPQVIEEGAQILDITPVAFRKRLSRARQRLRCFIAQRCGLINPSLTCRCVGSICQSRDGALLLAEPPQLDQAIGEWQHIYPMAALFREHPLLVAPEALVAELKRFLSGKTLTLL